MGLSFLGSKVAASPRVLPALPAFRLMGRQTALPPHQPPQLPRVYPPSPGGHSLARGGLMAFDVLRVVWRRLFRPLMPHTARVVIACRHPPRQSRPASVVGFRVSLHLPPLRLRSLALAAACLRRLPFAGVVSGRLAFRLVAPLSGAGGGRGLLGHPWRAGGAVFRVPSVMALSRFGQPAAGGSGRVFWSSDILAGNQTGAGHG